jgi:hypothetical protein
MRIKKKHSTGIISKSNDDNLVQKYDVVSALLGTIPPNMYVTLHTS